MLKQPIFIYNHRIKILWFFIRVYSSVVCKTMYSRKRGTTKSRNACTSKKTPNSVSGICRALSQNASTSRVAACSGSPAAPRVQPLITTVNAAIRVHQMAQLQRFSCSSFCFGLDPMLMLLPAN